MTPRLRAGAVALTAVWLVGVAQPASGVRRVVSATLANTWDPRRVRAAPGTRVTWDNPTGVSHDVRSYGGNWRLNRELSPGESVSRRFRRRGVYRYYCTLHGALSGGECFGMCGVVRVRR